MNDDDHRSEPTDPDSPPREPTTYEAPRLTTYGSLRIDTTGLGPGTLDVNNNAS